MRAIIRFSVDGEEDNKLGLRLRKILTDGKFRNSFNTGTYENNRVSVRGLAFVLEAFWSEAAAHKGPRNPGKLDHFWMYTHSKKKARKQDITGNSAKISKPQKDNQ